MRLKEIRMNGFKSYKLQTVVDNLDPKHNVVVGRNGSGKSNFFSAIEFVLSDAYSSLRPAQRVSLINKGSSKNRSDTAFVEIVFDQSLASENNSSTETCTSIRRTISATKDQYTVNGRNATRKEVDELLDTLGLSPSNPYYIVKQGTISKLTTSRPRQLLELLYETGGIRAYDEKLKQIDKLWQDADKRLEQIRTDRAAQAKRFDLLDTQQKEQKKFEQLEKKHRVLQFVALEKKQQQAREQLEQLAQEGQEWEVRQRKLFEQRLEAVNCMKELKRLQKQHQTELTNAEEQRANHKEEHLRLDGEKAKVDLMLEDMQNDLKMELEVRDSEKELLQKHNEEIESLQHELKSISREWSKVQQRRDTLEMDVSKKKQRRTELLNKLHRGEQFSSREERDRFLQQETAYVRQQIASETNALHEAKQALEELKNELTVTKGNNEKDTEELERLTKQEQLQQTELARITTLLQDGKGVLDELQTNEACHKHEQSKCKSRKADLEQTLRQRIGVAMYQGWKSVRKVLQKLGDEDKYDHVREGYGGIVLELFECDEELYPAVETIASKSLLNHVVETEAVANTIIKLCNKHHLPGEFQFMPLNRIRPTKYKYPQDDRSVTPLISLLKYAPDNEAILQQIFGKVLLCDDMETAVNATRNYGLVCVTIEGDIVRRGVMTGGYRAPKDSIIRVKWSLSALDEQIAELDVRCGLVAGEILKATKFITDTEMDQEHAERVLEQHQRSGNDIRDRIRHFPELCRKLEEKCAEKATKIRSLEMALELLREKLDSFERERATPFICERSEEDERMIEQLDAEIRAIGQKNHEAFNAQLKVEQRKAKIENRLNVILIPKRDSLVASQAGTKCIELREQILQCKQKQDSLTTKIKHLLEKIQHSEKVIHNATEQSNKLKKELEVWLDELKALEEAITIGDPDQMRYESRKCDLENELRQYAEQIGALGVLPAVDRVYQTMTLSKLMKELDQTSKQMKKYSCVNKAATDESNRLLQDLNAIDRQLKQVEDSRKLQEESIQQLRTQRVDCLEQTFANVSHHFSAIFKKLVPTGCGRLSLQTADDGAGDDEARSSREPNAENGTVVERYVGLRLEVSFHSSNGEVMREMNALSGGQKTLVAIALLFAIQRNKPAPFHLFDEIDQALDAHHRKVIAGEIAALSANSQFICITFRRELVERADKCFGVRYRNNMSFIDPVTKQEAYDFITDASIHR